MPLKTNNFSFSKEFIKFAIEWWYFQRHELLTNLIIDKREIQIILNAYLITLPIGVSKFLIYAKNSVAKQLVGPNSRVV